MDYYEAGATVLLIRGFDPLNDAIQYGRELLPLVHAEVARRERAAAVEAPATASAASVAAGGTR